MNIKVFFKLFAKSNIIILLLIIPLMASQDCSSPVECYTKAISILEKDRQEMRRIAEKFENMYLNLEKENLNLKEKITSLETSLKNYVDRPYVSLNNIIYKSQSLSTNLSAITLNEIIPKEAKKILVYAGISSGFGNQGKGYVYISTKLNGNLTKRILRYDNYKQDAWNTNSEIFEIDIDGGDLNLYYSSDINYNESSFHFEIRILGYK